MDKNNSTSPSPLLAAFTDIEAPRLATQGYVVRAPFLDPAFADALPTVVDREIAAGRITPARDRIVRGIPTEWIASMGPTLGVGPGSRRYEEVAPELRQLFEAVQQLGGTYNAVRAAMLATGAVTAQDAPAIAIEGMEMNVNRTIGPWSGLHLHDDRTRFNQGLQAVPANSIYHDAVKARALTVSGYARPLSAAGVRMNDLGGALPFVVRTSVRNPGDKHVFDIVPAYHNHGAVFFPGTLHGVARMPLGGIRYSFQAFFPAAADWDLIERRIAAGELNRATRR